MFKVDKGHFEPQKFATKKEGKLMLNIAILIFAIGAVGGLVLASSVLRGRLAPWALSLLHMALGATGLVLTLDSDNLRSVPVHWDAERIDQLLTTLLTNSERYTDAPGRVHIRLVIHGTDVCIAVDDSSPAVKPEHLDQIFEPFHRVDSRLTRTVGGTGLGLAITRRILDAQGGRIEVQSAPGAGATFLVRMPIMSVE
jgi:two-component system sensor histidine kinase BaeS